VASYHGFLSRQQSLEAAEDVRDVIHVLIDAAAKVFSHPAGTESSKRIVAPQVILAVGPV